jgi:deazaflavin-dependent oxidoreductase (nitroreductase family)
MVATLRHLPYLLGDTARILAAEMPLPRPFRRVARALNPAVLPLARRVRPLAVVEHTGRRTGRRYRSPVMAFPSDGGWLIALAYGEDVHWRANLERSGGGRLVQGGVAADVALVGVRDRAEVGDRLPGWARALLGPADVRRFVELAPPA